MSLQFVEESSRPTLLPNVGPLVVLRNKIVALACSDVIEVWNWATMEHLRSIRCVASESIERTSDGRLIVAGKLGEARIGDPAKWDDAKVIPLEGRPHVCSLLATQDDSLLTTDEEGKVTIWRNGKAQAVFDGICRPLAAGSGRTAFTGIPLAIVGSRIVTLGATSTSVTVIEKTKI